MKCALTGWCLLAALAVPAAGDRVTLKDGRCFEGAAREEDGKVLIDMPLGTVSFPFSDVLRIERMPTVADQLEVRLVKTDRTDPEALFAVASWARENDLVRRSDELLQEVLSLDGNHAAARRLLGFVKMDGKWMKLPAALQLAQGKLEGGKHGELLGGVLRAMEDVAGDLLQKIQVRRIEGDARLRARQFPEATQCYEWLADKATGPEAVRFAAIVEVLKAHPDGMYVLTEAYPPTAMLLAAPAAAESGPGSLSRPDVLSAALRDLARNHIKTARALMEQGKQLELTEPEAAKAKYAQAGKSFDAADAIVPNFARSYRVEVARRQIAMITKDMNTEAGKFDTFKAELGQRDLAPPTYANLVQRMLRALNNVRGDLEAILQLAGPFERELVLEITDANLRLQRVNGLRDILNQELHGK